MLCSGSGVMDVAGGQVGCVDGGGGQGMGDKTMKQPVALVRSPQLAPWHPGGG